MAIAAPNPVEECSSKLSGWSIGSDFADEVHFNLAGPPVFPGRNLRPEFLVQGISFSGQLGGWERPGELQHSIRNVIQGVAELAFQVLLHALGTIGCWL